jgi:hypothetical protein
MTNSVIQRAKAQGFKSAAPQATPQQTPQPATPQQPAPIAPAGQLPAMSRVLQQNAIATTQASIEQVQRLSEKRTEVVLQAFDHYMDASDAAIVEGLKDRLGSRNLDFFAAVPVEAGEDAIDLDQAFADLMAWAKPATSAEPLLSPAA